LLDSIHPKLYVTTSKMGTTYSLTPSKPEPISDPLPVPSSSTSSGWPIERRTILMALGALLISLIVGILGYWWICGFSWEDSYLNATMIMGGMGPVGDLKTTNSKIFAGLYAVYCGVFFLVIIAFLFDKILSHRMKKE
jgi:hypothetical protein